MSAKEYSFYAAKPVEVIPDHMWLYHWSDHDKRKLQVRILRAGQNLVRSTRTGDFIRAVEFAKNLIEEIRLLGSPAANLWRGRRTWDDVWFEKYDRRHGCAARTRRTPPVTL